MKKLITLLPILALTLTTFASPALADVCQPVYGGGQTCTPTNIVINKTVASPSNGAFVENLTVNDPKYTPGQNVTFRLAVTNTGNATLSQVFVKDFFPQFIDFVSGPGSFDNGNKVLSFEVDNLGVSETRTFDVVGRFVGENSLSGGVTCVTNQSTATTMDNKSSQDNASACVEKKVLGAATTFQVVQPVTPKGVPATGPESYALLALLPTGMLGAFLRKKSSSSK